MLLFSCAQRLHIKETQRWQYLLRKDNNLYRSGQTKEMGLGLLGAIHCGKVSRRWMVDKGCLGRFVLQTQVVL